jgi:hypothetical protein
VEAPVASKKKIWLVLLIPVGLVLGYLYFFYDPAMYTFLACPSKKFLGISCPGCGSQRAVHQLLHGHVQQAFVFNPLLVLALPYLLLSFIFEFQPVRKKYPAFRKRLFGRTAIFIILAIVLVFWMVRNLYSF